MIGPGPVNKYQPLIFFDGFPFNKLRIDSLDGFQNLIESVSIEKDTLFDEQGNILNIGFVIINSKDSLNTGLKYILQKTGSWIYNNPYAMIEINGVICNLDKQAWFRLVGLKPKDILSIELKSPDSHSEYRTGLIRLKIHN